MFVHTQLTRAQLASLIKGKQIVLAGNKQLKIYGTIYCESGKRMKKENRVFFASESEAISHGYRPCAHCLNAKYKAWKGTTKSRAD